jgi:molybdopterin-guanine dinucleotide biosynthesis protein A
VKKNATAIILAGGKSTRMGGGDKSLLPVNGIPLIQHIANQLDPHFDEIIIGANDVEKYDFLGFRIIPDVENGKGPLMGIYSCLNSSQSEINFVTGCDVPTMNIEMIKNMLELTDGVDIVMPVKNQNEYEPLYAIYRKTIVPMAEQVLQRGGRKIIDLLQFASVRYFKLTDTSWYCNINTKDDFERFLKNLSLP